jgi:CRP/FNR family transcriptional regulator, cyclic AMP receptor protein
MSHPDFAILTGLDDAQRRAVLAACRRRSYAARMVVFHEGDPGDTMHLVLSGRLAVRVTTPLGHVATLSILTVGDAFGELALLDPEARRTATVVALEPVECLTLDRAQVAALRSTHPQLERLVTDMLAGYVRRLSAMVLEMMYLPVDTRVARRLDRLAEVYSGEIRLTQDDLASMAGTTRATTNAVLRSLEQAGVVRLRRGRVSVLDRAALARAAR